MFCREFNSEYQLCYYYDDVTVMLFINIKYDDVAVPVKASGNEQRYVLFMGLWTNWDRKC